MQMYKNRFMGWYFKHRSKDGTVCFIPGHSADGAFVQVISPGRSDYFPVSNLQVANGKIYAGKCVFSTHGAIVRLPGITGNLVYGKPTPLHSDIMGPFRFLPLECRHGVISMCHTMQGSLSVYGKTYNFGGGSGYIECDGGTSFPKSYLWLQHCDSMLGFSAMLSFARIPFAGLEFNGFICAVIFDGREYRYATYNGAKIKFAGSDKITLRRGKLLFVIDIISVGGEFKLKSPVRGKMAGIIKESNTAGARFRLWDDGVKRFDISDGAVGYEYVR
jgi:hypothetical protein